MLSDIGEPTDTAEISSAPLASVASVGWRAGGVALWRVRRALRRKSALVRLLILPSLLRRPTLRLLGGPVATTATSLSNTPAATSLASLMVSFRDSSCVRPDLQKHNLCLGHCANTDICLHITVAMTNIWHTQVAETQWKTARME